MAKKNNSLLEIARSVGARRPKVHYKVTKEHIELFNAYAHGEITMKQCTRALGYKTKDTAYGYMLAIAKAQVTDEYES